METEGQQMSRYLYGLKPSIREKIGCQVILSLSEAHKLARRTEAMSFRGNFGVKGNHRSTGETSKQPSKISSITSSSSNTIQNEQVEKEAGKKQVVNPYSKPTGDKCYKCGIPGHRSNVCPQPRRQVNLDEYDENKNEEEDDYFKEDEGVCEPDGGDMPNFVVRKVLLAPKRVDTQRNMLFRTRCTISNHIFYLIIDGGSCENIISRDLVHKLKQPVESILSPIALCGLLMVRE